MLPNSSLLHDPTPVAFPPTVEVLDIPLALTDYSRTIELMEAFVAERQRGYVCVCNVHAVMASGEDPELRAALLSSSMNVSPAAGSMPSTA